MGSSTSDKLAIDALVRKAAETRSGNGLPKYDSAVLLHIQEAVVAPQSRISASAVSAIFGQELPEMRLFDAVRRAPDNEARRRLADAALDEHLESLGGFERSYLNHAFSRAATAIRSARDDIFVLQDAAVSLSEAVSLAREAASDKSLAVDGEAASKSVRTFEAIGRDLRELRSIAVAELASQSPESVLLAEASWNPAFDAWLGGAPAASAPHRSPAPGR